MENKLSTSAALPPSSLSSSLHFSENSMSESSPPFSKPTQSKLVTIKGKNDMSITNNTANKVDANVSISDHNDKMMDAELFTHVRSGLLSVLDQQENTSKQNVSSPERHLEQPSTRLAREAAGTQQTTSATATSARDIMPVMPLANANDNKEINKKQELVEDTGQFCNNESIAFDVLTENSIDFVCHTPESVKHNSTNAIRENDMHFAVPHIRDNTNSSSFLRSRESSETRPNNLSFENEASNNRYIIPRISDKSGVKTVYGTKGPPVPSDLFKEMQHRDIVNRMGNVKPLKYVQTKENSLELVFRALYNYDLQTNYYGFQEYERRSNTSLLDDNPNYKRQLERVNLDDVRFTPQQRHILQSEKEKLRIWQEEQKEKKRLHREKKLEQQRKRSLLLQQVKEKQKQEELEHEENNPSVQTNRTSSENNSTSHSRKSLSTKFNKLLGKIHCTPVGRNSAQEYEHYLNSSIATDSHRSSVSAAQPESHHASVHSLSLSTRQANQISTQQQETNNATSASMNGANSNTITNNISNNQESTSNTTTTTTSKKKRTIAGEIVHFFHKRSQKKKDKKAEKLRRKEMERVSEQNSTGVAAASVSKTNINNVNSNSIVANSSSNAATTSTSAAAVVDQVKKNEQSISETLNNKTEAIEMEEYEKHNPQMEEQQSTATGKLAVSTNTNNAAQRVEVNAEEFTNSATVTQTANKKQLELEVEKQPSAKEIHEHLISTSEEEKVKLTNAENNITANANNTNANVELKQNTTFTPHAHVLSTHEQRQSQPTMTLKLDESKNANINDDLDNDDENNNFNICDEDEDNINNHHRANNQDVNKGNMAIKDDTKLSSKESNVKKAKVKNNENSSIAIGDTSKSKAAEHQKEKKETATNPHTSHSIETANVPSQRVNSQQEKEESEESEYNEEEEEEEYYEEEKTEEEEHHSHVHFDTSKKMIKEQMNKDHALRSDNINDKHAVHENYVDSKEYVAEHNKKNDDHNKEKRKDMKYSSNSNKKKEHHTSQNKSAGSSGNNKEEHEEKECGNTAVNVMKHDQNKMSRRSLSSESTSSNTSTTSTTEEENNKKNSKLTNNIMREMKMKKYIHQQTCNRKHLHAMLKLTPQRLTM